MFECKELSAKFDTKEELIKALVNNKHLAVSSKKSNIVTHKICNFSSVGKDSVSDSNKSSLESVSAGDTIWATINTTGILDSHGDIHAKGIWNKSAREQNNKVYYIINHNLEIGNVIAYPKDVNIHVLNKKWRDLGYDADGSTEALTFEVKLTEYSNPDFMSALKSGATLQNSIRMRYIDVELCVNDKEYEAEHLMWQKYISEAVNRSEAEKLGYFWYVKEAAIVNEGSAVLFASNTVTPINTVKSNEPPAGTQLNKEEGNKNVPVWFNL